MHLRSIYYGDMKAPNLLIYRNQEVRIGDLGVSIKLDKTVDSEIPCYPVKGLTKGFGTEVAMQSFEKGIPLSRK